MRSHWLKPEKNKNKTCNKFRIRLDRKAETQGLELEKKKDFTIYFIPFCIALKLLKWGDIIF